MGEQDSGDTTSAAVQKSSADEQDEAKNTGTRWIIADVLKAVSIGATFVVSVFSILVSVSAHKNAVDNAQTIATTRVETGTAITNSNYSDFANPWTPWEEPITPTTTFIGVQRVVLFKRAFGAAPSVTTGYSLIDTASGAQIMTAVGYPLVNEMEGSQDIHLVTDTDGVTEKGFTLKVGIGLRRDPELYLANKLQTTTAEAAIIRDMSRYGQLADRNGAAVSQNEQWLINFYKTVGSIRISWIAQDQER